MRTPPPIPLSAAAVVVYLTGLLAGFSGALPAALALGVFGAACAVHVRSLVVAAFAVVLASGALTARATTLRDARCAAALGARRHWTVELEDTAAPGGSARGRSAERACALPVRIAVLRGSAAPGTIVHVDGTVVDRARPLMITAATVRAVRAPGALRGLRTRAAAVVDSAFRRDAPLAKALLVADTRALTPEVRDRYAAAGLAHMLSISGLHVGLIAVALTLAAQLVRLPVTGARIATLVVLAFYIAVIGAPAPAVRAGVMLGVVTLCRLVQRPVSPWAILALGAAGPLADPVTATDLGYQLSVVGVVALIAADSLGAQVFPERVHGWRRAGLTALLGSTVACLVSLPVVAWTFGRVSLVAPLTNLAAAPLMTVAQPMLFLALVLGWAPSAARFVADAAHPLLWAFDSIASLAAGLPHATIDIAPTLPAAVLAGAATAAFVAACMSRHPGRALTVGIGLLAVIAWLPALPTGTGQTELHVIDVGQGDAIALRTARGRWVLVDAGRTWRGGDAGRTTVVPYLRRRRGSLVAFVLTHPHADHVGGAATVVRTMRPGLYYDAAFAGGGDAYRASLASAARTGVRWRRVHPGDSLQVDEATIAFLAPDSAWTAQLADPNEASAVVLVRVGAVRFLLTGDAERREEEWLVERAGARLRADVLKVAHHGSATSTTAEFLAAVRPSVAVISVGAGNPYGHPDPTTVRALAAAGAQVLRTDRLGTIVLRTDGHTLAVEANGDSWPVSTPSLPR